jgi:sec-independent protein translocase protein TatA
MGGFSLIHWLILGLFILLLFGGSRFSAMMGDVAKGLKSFKQGMADEDHSATRPADPRTLPPQQQQPIDVTPQPQPPVADPTASPPPPPADDQTRA